ncbi:LacI family DNA-binding transcriptional regulator [Luteimonas abyssi]|uniref:LacI family DNA-binding transcriptional regulator n=1 Tax=Luteimonas abyssi TaxID=1247514 RepID=UPI000737CCDF|nr:LacI family DNA-binding transcriptional regulator [Luteimonas abyssi]
MSITIKDVAREANVSVATVSRALNGHENVAAEVRKRVFEVADRLRYTPHHAARSLSSRRTQTVGVVLPDLYGEFFSELMRGIDAVARSHGLHLLVSSYHGDPDEQASALRAMRGRVDGLLLMSPFASEAGHGGVADPGMPAVLLNSGAGGALPALNVDSYGGARAMTRHLLDTGHRHIAFIAGPEDNHDARERLRGYRDELATVPGAVESRVVQGDFEEAAGHAAGQEVLAGATRPDAVFAANDMMALGCLFAFNQAGVRVPDDIALAGFDDIPLARYVHPGLTTMRVDIAELGGRALRLLLDRLGGEGTDGTPADERLPVELVIRESSRKRRTAA